MLHFDEQLAELNDELTLMGNNCVKIIGASIKTLFERDDGRELYKQNYAIVMALENEINLNERATESLCMRLLLRYQPVARDFRAISSALKLISDMERIGDQAMEIAVLSRHIKPSKVEDETFANIKSMAEETSKMVTRSVLSFTNKDSELAKHVIEYDRVVDELFFKVRSEVIAYLGSVESSRSELYVDLLMVAKYLERIGDHAVNVGEWVYYSITGEHVRTVTAPDGDTV
ncbi:phosphate transport system regulatory protein PhoU [Clostridia bacterium]|nr:phosphate transport system regulatory protein PhoU [Clostridia bacterium]GHU57491.1 phosphate transport system regulatory protein PhoU [Clostridia bacterium]